MKKHTIKDIALLAGVSKGTVDRVIHKRGKVSEKALEKVNKVLNEIDYQPNLIARSLKNNKSNLICTILPNPDMDPYWNPCQNGTNEAIEEFKTLGITIETYLFDPTDTNSFLETHTKVMQRNPDAVLLAPLFYNESTKAIKSYNDSNISVCTINNRTEIENINSFIGQDLVQSGRTAARLMEMVTPKNSEIIIAHLDEFFINASFMQQKEKGFRDYFDSLPQSNYDIKTCNSIESNNYKTLYNAIESSKKVSGIFVTTSKTHKVAKILKDLENTSIKIIGYDLLEENIEYLKKRNIDFLIHQNPKLQVYMGLKLLSEHLIFNKIMPDETILPFDIVNSENYNLFN